jgi:GTP-binding protein YchF
MGTGRKLLLQAPLTHWLHEEFFMLGIGIVGLPNVGKSTLFNAITKAGVEAANYPFATIDKNVGVVALPDERLEALKRLYTKGEKVPPTIPTTVEFVDIAGLVKGASKGEGLGNQFLANIREVSAIAHVVRCFDDPDVIHVAGKVDPAGDIDTIDTELALADLSSLEKRIEKLRRSAKSNKEDALVVDAAERMMAQLSEGVPARATGIELPADFNLLTDKPVIYVCNVPETDVVDGNAYVDQVRARAAQEGAEVVVISAKIEGELGELGEEEGLEFLQDLGLTEPGLNRLIRKGYDALGLLTFFTAGEKEVRAWTVTRGAKAPQAAGEIHSDFERGFIRAEVVSWNKLVEAGGIPPAKAKGWVRTEGKEYIVQDGDVMHFLFNV